MTRIVQRKRELLQELKKDLAGYFRETTVHGFRYVVEGRNIFERLVWATFIILGFSYSIVTVYNAYQYWEDHPVEITIDAVGVPLQELPFPAITVCDTKSLQMPRKNRWMLLEKLLNSLELLNPKEQMKKMNPGMCDQSHFIGLKLDISLVSP